MSRQDGNKIDDEFLENNLIMLHWKKIAMYLLQTSIIIDEFDYLKFVSLLVFVRGDKY